MKKLFTNDKFFLAMVLCAVVCELAYALCNITLGDYAVQSQLVLLFRILCVLVLYSSYKKHSKNVMKGMMGSLLAAQLITAVLLLPEIYVPIDKVCGPLFALLSALLFISHYLINSEHHSSPAWVRFNQILVLLLFLNNAVWAVVWLILDPVPIHIVLGIADIIGFLGMVAVVVCIESRLDAYRLDREAAGWTEEKGYPEGYVHEYEKKDNK